MKFISSVFALLISLLFANLVHATSVTVSFTGRVTAPLSAGPLIGAVENTPITGSFTYETTATPTTSFIGQQSYDGAISDLSISVGSANMFEVNPLGFTDTLSIQDGPVLNGPDGDQLFFTRTVTGQESGGVTPLSVQLSFNDATGVALSSLSVPLTISSAFTNNTIQIFFVGDNEFDVTQLFGVIDSVTPVPIPAAIWLFLSGIAGLFGVRRLKTQ